MIKKIIFDLDNTLIKFPKDYHLIYNKVIEKYNINITSKDLFDLIGIYESSGQNDYYDKQKLIDLLNKEHNLNLGTEFIDDFLELLCTLTSPIDDGVIETLEYLKDKYELVVLTNWFTYSQVERLKNAGIYKYFSNVYGTDIIPMKPRKECFMSVIGDLKPEECLMIGDNLDIDIKVPYEMGINVYHLNKFGTSKYPTIKKIEELKEIL